MDKSGFIPLLVIMLCAGVIAVQVVTINLYLGEINKTLASINKKLDDNLAAMSNTVNEWRDAKSELIKKRVLKTDN